MANEIKDKYGSTTALTISLASLASSTSGVGRQSTLVDNSTSKYQDILVYVKIKQGTSPTGSRGVYVYLIRDDADGTTPHRTDGAGSSDAAWTASNAQIIGSMRNLSSPATGDVLYGEFVVNRPGPKFGIGIVHNTKVNLDATGSSHWVRYVGLNPEIQ